MMPLPLGCICGGWIEASLLVMGFSAAVRFFKKKEKHDHCSHDKDIHNCSQDHQDVVEKELP